MVRRMRLELTQPNGHYPLKVACLPISPPPQVEWAKNGTRTRDPDLGKVVLYQLSYFRKLRKTNQVRLERKNERAKRGSKQKEWAKRGSLWEREPKSARLEAESCSHIPQVSGSHQHCCGERDRTTDLQVMSLASYHCSTPRYLRCVRDSNPWPPPWQGDILTNWTNAPKLPPSLRTDRRQSVKAEREGFEPPVRFRTPVFKTGVIDHSTISPM